MFNSFSAQFAQELRTAFPRWALRIRADSSVTPGALILKVPSPNPHLGPLLIGTQENEITIGFEEWHTHFGRWSGLTQERAIPEAIQFLREITEEQIVFLFSLEGGKRVAAEIIRTYELQGVEKSEDVEIRSWNGTYDAGHDS